jgi:hypothetical protein
MDGSDTAVGALLSLGHLRLGYTLGYSNSLAWPRGGEESASGSWACHLNDR